MQQWRISFKQFKFLLLKSCILLNLAYCFNVQYQLWTKNTINAYVLIEIGDRIWDTESGIHHCCQDSPTSTFALPLPSPIPSSILPLAAHYLPLPVAYMLQHRLGPSLADVEGLGPFAQATPEVYCLCGTTCLVPWAHTLSLILLTVTLAKRWVLGVLIGAKFPSLLWVPFCLVMPLLPPPLHGFVLFYSPCPQ